MKSKAKLSKITVVLLALVMLIATAITAHSTLPTQAELEVLN